MKTSFPNNKFINNTIQFILPQNWGGVWVVTAISSFEVLKHLRGSFYDCICKI